MDVELALSFVVSVFYIWCLSPNSEGAIVLPFPNPCTPFTFLASSSAPLSL